MLFWGFGVFRFAKTEKPLKTRQNPEIILLMIAAWDPDPGISRQHTGPWRRIAGEIYLYT